MRTARIIQRSMARAMKGRTAREKKMVQMAFTKGAEFGGSIQKARILNATAGMTYEEEAPETVTPVDDTVGPVGSDYVDNLLVSCPGDTGDNHAPSQADQVSHL